MSKQPKRLNKGAKEISAGGWNSLRDMYSDYYDSPRGGFKAGPSVLRGSTIVDVVLADGAEKIAPYQPCRIVGGGKFLQEIGSTWITVEPVDRADTDKHGNYGFSLAEGVTKQAGGRVVIAGLAVVTVTRAQARDNYVDGDGVFNEGKYDSSYYIVPDGTLSSDSSKVIGPVGHFKLLSWYDTVELEKQHKLLADDLLMVVDLAQRATNFQVKLDTAISGTTEATEVITMSSGTALAYYGVSDSQAAEGEHELKVNEAVYEIEVYNTRLAQVSTGTHTATYSVEYNRFIFVGGGSATFQVTMEQRDGIQGTSTTPASWTYDIKIWEGDDSIIKADAGIVDAPNHYRRPNIGQLSKATFGTATYNSADELVIIDCNETLIITTC